MKILICGGRDCTDSHLLQGFLASLHPRPTLIIEGGARGADRLGREWAITNKVEYKTFEADWNRFGKGAGYVRNSQMLKDGRPDLVVALPGGKGTANMVSISKKAGVSVSELSRTSGKG